MGQKRRDFILGALSVAAVAMSGVRAIFGSVSAEVVDDELLSLSATEVLSLFASREVSSERYCSALLAQCHRRKDLNAFIWLNEDHLMDAARTADKRRNEKSKAPLLGLPVALKDNIDTADAPTTAGTPALRGHRPSVDAPVAASLFSAGALLLGKTNMHELAFGITSNNAAFGAVHNPYNRLMIPGGSSGGTAAAVAAHLCPVGLGTDTGGSVRIPAALCGIAGLRTSAGRYSLKGVVPLSHTRDTVGPMARSVLDLVLLDSVVTDATTPVKRATLEGMRFGIPRSYFYSDLDPEVMPVIDTALNKLRDAGCIFVEGDIPDFERLTAISGQLSYYECVTDLSRYLAEEGVNLSAQDVIRQIASPDVRELYETYGLGSKAPTREWYEHAMAVDRPALQAAYRAYFRDRNVVAMVFPTTVLPARPIGEDTEVELNGKKIPTMLAYVRNARPVTTAGIPGLSVPVGLTSTGLPVGLEFDGPQNHDRELLGIGMAVESVFGKLPLPPPT
jgi:Asp-tRNA(Asn)/Glu-tRNA(Gln) amidotransferase A subunit family amidase